MNWNFAARTQTIRRSTIREILKLTAQPDVISFAGGLPAPEHFPLERVQSALDTILSERGRESLQYSTTEGMPELRDLLAARLSTSAVTLTRENILIVGGSQQGLDLIGRVLLDADDGVIVENPTYLGMLLAWRPFGVRFLPVATDENGLQPAEVAAHLRLAKPRLVYSVPTFQNPQGITLSAARRAELVALLGDVPLVEDSAYAELRYSGQPAPPLYHFDALHRGNTTLDGGGVIYCGTFSKILTPGLRVGWVAAPTPVIEKLVQAKQSADLHTSTLNQFICYELARDGFLDAHIAQLQEVYRTRRDVMLAAFERYFPDEVRWSKPEGGLFLMVYLPAGVDAAALLQEALLHKVAFVPGVDFHLEGSGQNTLRLNFSNAQPERIEDGVRRLGGLLRQKMGC